MAHIDLYKRAYLLEAFIFKESFKFASILEQTVVLISILLSGRALKLYLAEHVALAGAHARASVERGPDSRWSLKTIPCPEACLFVTENLVGQDDVDCFHSAAALSSSSASIMALTPSYMSWTRSFSERPRRRRLEISKMPSLVSECSPWLPRICT